MKLHFALSRLLVSPVVALLALWPAGAFAQAVPGSGYKVEQVGDDFEDESWSYTLNSPKSSQEQDGGTRFPSGYSSNGRWVEGLLRGNPDVARRVETPTGGIEGSTGALELRTLRSGVPGRTSREPQQDDLLANVGKRINGHVPAAWWPSVVTRVYLPEFDQWEPRSAVSFGFRLAVQGRKGRSSSLESYWPGIFVRFYSKANGYKEDSAALVIRGSVPGGDVMGPRIKEPGWWTLGMSLSPDGQVHFYGRQGVESLTADDHLASYYCYGFRAERLQTFFFDVCNMDNGRSWSTSWVVDDTWMYAARPIGKQPAPPVATKPTDEKRQ